MYYNTSEKTAWLAKLAALTAIIFLMSFVPYIGYIKVGIVDITLIIIPVAVGALTLGPKAGAILGGVFGLTSFMQAAFGLSPFGVLLFDINPLYTALLCFIPRILVGWLAGLIFIMASKWDKTKIVGYIVGSLSTALLNTAFFMVGLVLLFKNTFVVGAMREMGITKVMDFLIAIVGINGLIEAGVCMVVGATVAKLLSNVKNR